MPPPYVNYGGKVHGGYVMHWISSTAKLVAERWHQGEARATFAGGVRFYRPMFIGDLVEVEARLILTEGSLMHVSVHVRTGDPRSAEPLPTSTHCTMVYSALDARGAPTDVRPWRPSLPEDVRLEDHARALITIRRKLLRPDPA